MSHISRGAAPAVEVQRGPTLKDGALIVGWPMKLSRVHRYARELLVCRRPALVGGSQPPALIYTPC
jgi:hypothetical protein